MYYRHHQTLFFQWIIACLLAMLLFTPMPNAYAEAAKGKITLEFTTPKESPHKEIAEYYEQHGPFQALIEELNKDLILPTDLTVSFQVSPGPLYDPNAKKIYMSYALIDFLSKLYLEATPGATDEDMVNVSIRSSIFIFYHELGHALIDIYDLPVVSNQETAADNLATVLALELNEDGYDIAMDAAFLWDILDASNEEYSPDELWDEHALDSQRFYNVLCLVYGKYPDEVIDELEERGDDVLLDFIDTRKEYCAAEYHNQYRAWMKLLLPHIRNAKANS